MRANRAQSFFGNEVIGGMGCIHLDGLRERAGRQERKKQECALSSAQLLPNLLHEIRSGGTGEWRGRQCKRQHRGGKYSQPYTLA